MMGITIPVGEIGATRGLQIRFIWIRHWEMSNSVETADLSALCEKVQLTQHDFFLIWRACQLPQFAAQVRHTPIGKWHRHKIYTGTARPQRHTHHPALHPRKHQKIREHRKPIGHDNEEEGVTPNLYLRNKKVRYPNLYLRKFLRIILEICRVLEVAALKRCVYLIC
jgi:hypothetical protein